MRGSSPLRGRYRREPPDAVRRPAGRALVFLALAAIAGGCGHKGAPMAPVRVRPGPVKDLGIRQQGAKLVLTLRVPKTRTDGTPFEGPVRLRLVQVVPPELQPLRAKARKRAPGAREREIVAWTIPREDWPKYETKERLRIPISISSLEFPPAGSRPAPGPRRVAFVAEVQEGRRKRGEIAGPVALTLCEAPPAPLDLDARPAPGGILLAWKPGGGPSAPPAVSNLYRAEEKEPFPEKPYRVIPAGTNRFLDENVLMGRSYRYEMRTASGEEKQACESTAASAAVTAVDRFAPEPPKGLAAAAETSLIRLFWSPSPEPDLAGYKVYRSDAPGEPFHLLTPSPITETTYADTAVERGKRYTYVVTAVDNAQPPNESERSKPAGEVLP